MQATIENGATVSTEVKDNAYVLPLSGPIEQLEAINEDGAAFQVPAPFIPSSAFTGRPPREVVDGFERRR